MNTKRCRLKFIGVLLIIFSIISLFGASAERAIPEPTRQFYVNDFANVLTDEQEAEMNALAFTLAKRPSGIQVVVTTIDSLNGQSINDYATDMYNKYKIGRDSRGILFLISIKDRKYKAEVGYGLEQYFTDSKCGQIIRDNGKDYLSNNQFDLGVMSIQKAFIKEMEILSNVLESTPAPTPSAPKLENENENSFPVWRLFCIMAGYILLIVLLVLSYIRNKKYKSNCNYIIAGQEYDIENLKRDNNNYAGKIKEKNEAIKEKNEAIVNLRMELEALSLKFKRAVKLYPDLEEEIKELTKKEEEKHNQMIAKFFDESFSYFQEEACLTECLQKCPNGYSLLEETYNKCFDYYNKLTSEQKKLIKTDIQEVKKRFEEGMTKISQTIAKEYNQALDEYVRTTTASDYYFNTFEHLCIRYDAMSSKAKEFVDQQLLAKLLSMKKKAEDERYLRIQREKKERERLSNMSYSSHTFNMLTDNSSNSSSYDTSSSFSDSSGFGGSSGGAGAGGDF